MVSNEFKIDLNQFRENPEIFLERAIKDYVLNSPVNKLVDFDFEPIFEEPVVVFADGDASIFTELKKVIGDFHMTPREALEKHLKGKFWKYTPKLEHVSVISYVLPMPLITRQASRSSKYGGARRHNYTRWQGEVFQKSLQHYICSLLEVMKHDAVAPRRENFFEWTNLPDSVRVNWSERHVAYASGLGTFGLNSLLITPKGCGQYLGSVVCDVELKPSGIPYQNHHAYCLFYQNGGCKKCAERCAAGAIDENGRNHVKCRQYLTSEQRPLLKANGLDEGLVGPAAACGLCMTGVPCEDRIPGGQ